MKNLIFLVSAIFIAVFVACSGDSKKSDGSADTTKTGDSTKNTSENKGKYNLKSGIISFDIETMNMVQKMTKYFDDYGDKECDETISSMDLGMAGKVETHTKMLTLDGYIYNINFTNKTGTKSKITPNAKGKSDNIDFNNLSADIMKEMHITKEGTETVLQKTCDKYKMDNPELNMKSSYCVWDGIPLKFEVNMAGAIAKYNATKIEENVSVPAEKFEIPKDIKITEMK
ncbi:MAG: hypothetical protein V1904_14315 [Bacteroidota bacterium]